MYRFVYIPVFLLTLLLASCTSCSDSKKKGIGEQKPVNPEVEKLDNTPDEAIFAHLDKYDNDSVYITLSGSRAKKSYCYHEAVTTGRFHGSMTVGDDYSFFPDNRNKSISIAINTTELSGRWIYDEKKFRGFDFNGKGGMSSINNDDLCFREWKLLNGKLYIYTVGVQDVAGDRHQYDVEEAEIYNLNKDNLTISFRGKQYTCHRPSSKPLLFKP